MKLFPAIDLYDGKAVRLFKGDYREMTVYSENPIEIARDFERCGATCIHMVLPEFAQVHVHCITYAVQPSHPLMPFSPPALNLSQRQGLFQ